ncbi:hypothetical protein AcV7_010341 [Taiwanofungus camphoratus]|nr:hypothetical protein AcV7_010341 [Antrodia cinnamomea]
MLAKYFDSAFLASSARRSDHRVAPVLLGAPAVSSIRCNHIAIACRDFISVRASCPVDARSVYTEGNNMSAFAPSRHETMIAALCTRRFLTSPTAFRKQPSVQGSARAASRTCVPCSHFVTVRERPTSTNLRIMEARQRRQHPALATITRVHVFSHEYTAAPHQRCGAPASGHTETGCNQ